MGLADFFRPKWKNSDTSVRIAAVRSLDSDEIAILSQIAKNDHDENVRRLAIRKISDAEALSELARDHLDGSLQDLAQERAASLWLNKALQSDAEIASAALECLDSESDVAEVAKKSQLDEIRLAAFERINDPKSFADIARQAKEKSVRLAAVGEVDDQMILRRIAISGEHRDVALAALDKLDDPDQLRLVSKQAQIKTIRSRSEKKFRSLTRSKKKAPVEGPTEQERFEHKRAQLIQICNRAENLNEFVDDPEIEDKIRELQEQWKTLSQVVPEEHEKLDSRFTKAIESFRGERKIFQNMMEEREKSQENLLKDESDRKEICTKIDALKGGEDFSEFESLLGSWLDLGDIPQGHKKDWNKTFETAKKSFLDRRDAIEGRAQARSDFEKLVSDLESATSKEEFSPALQKEVGSIERKWRKLAGRFGVDDDLKEKFDEIKSQFDGRVSEAREKKEKAKKENFEKLSSLVERLISLEESEDLKASEKALKDGRAAFKNPGPMPSKKELSELRKKYREAEQKVQAKVLALREAEDWKRLFNVPKQEELCKRAESLLEMDDLKEAAQQLKLIQSEWKKVGPVPKGKSDELWNRFKQACDQAYEKCGSYFVQMKNERVENLEKKKAICAEAETLAESTDWKITADRLKELQSEWKKIGPVDRKSSDAVWKNFRASCDTFFNRRKEHFNQLDEERKENYTLKLSLCEKAEELVESSEWKETAEKLKDLQAEWKAIGPVPRKHSNTIWARFRGACDHFFARRESHLDGGRQANLQKKIEICETIESYCSETTEVSPEEIGKSVAEYWKEWKNIGNIPFDEVENTENRFSVALSGVIDNHPESLKDTELDPENNFERRKKILQSIEKLVESSNTNGEDGKVQVDAQDNSVSIAEKLKQAMARNAFRQETQTSEKQRTEERAEKFLNSYRNIPPIQSERMAELEERFSKAYESITGHPIPSRDKKSGDDSPKRSGKNRRNRPQSRKKRKSEPHKAEEPIETPAEAHENNAEQTSPEPENTPA